MTSVDKIHITPDDQSQASAYLKVDVNSMFPQTDPSLYDCESLDSESAQSGSDPSKKTQKAPQHQDSPMNTLQTEPMPNPPSPSQSSISLSTARPDATQVEIDPKLTPSPQTIDKGSKTDEKIDFESQAQSNREAVHVMSSLNSDDTPQLLIVPPEDAHPTTSPGSSTTTPTSRSTQKSQLTQQQSNSSQTPKSGLNVDPNLTYGDNKSAQNTPLSTHPEQTDAQLTPRQQQLRDQQIAEEHMSRNRQMLQIERVIVRKQNYQEWGTYRIDKYGRVVNEPQTDRHVHQLPPNGSIDELNQQVGKLPRDQSSTQHITPSESSTHLHHNTSHLGTTTVNNLQASHAIDPKALQKKMEREKKWVDMVANWDKTNPNLLKSRVRKGIPSSMRGVVWELILQLPVAKAKYPARYYYDLLSQPVTESNEIQIRKDLPRLMQDNVMFKSPEAGSRTVMCSGQAMLYNILKAYTVHDPEVGYVQGMDSIAAPALLYFPEETTFWFLERLLQNPRYNLRDLYLPGFPLARKYVYIHQQLVKKHLPKLFKCMKTQMVQHDMYAFRWYTMRYAQFSPELSYRVLDMYLYEGDKILYRLALALLQLHEKELIARPDDMLENLKKIESNYELHKRNDGDFVIKKALSIDLVTADINKLALEYDKLVAQGLDTLLMD